MSKVQKVYNLTKNIIHLLDNENKLERTDIIEAVNELIDSREDVLEDVKPPYTENEKQIGGEIVQLNKEIEIKMADLFEEIKQDIVNFKQQKASNRSYINPYGQMETTDGMYLDKKK